MRRLIATIGLVAIVSGCGQETYREAAAESTATTRLLASTNEATSTVTNQSTTTSTPRLPTTTTLPATTVPSVTIPETVLGQVGAVGCTEREAAWRDPFGIAADGARAVEELQKWVGTPGSTTTTTIFEYPVVAVGQPVRGGSGNFEFTVTAVQRVGNTLGEAPLLDKALGVWFVVAVQVLNVGNRSATFYAQDQQVWFGELSFPADPFPWSATSAETVNPGVGFEAVLLFDVPKWFPPDGEGAVLLLQDGWSESCAEVRL